MDTTFRIQPAHPDLPAVRDATLATLKTLLPGADVHEVGATAVAGCIGKGDLDILVRVADVNAARTILDAHFSRNPDQLKNDDYQGYLVDVDFDAALQVTRRDGPHDDFLGFLDALSKPRVRHAYNALKRAWNGRPMDAYRQAKGAFIQAVRTPPDLPPDADVVVIGGSLTGVATALYLARAGVDVVLLEAKPFIGDSASGRAMGSVEMGVVEHPHRTMRALGDRYDGLLELTERNKALLEAEGVLERCGVLWCALDPREPPELAESAVALRNRGIAAEMWTEAQVETWTGAALGPALWLSGDGRIDPFGALETLRARAVEAGVRIVCNAPATLVDSDEVRVRVRDTELSAEMVVIAAGYGATALDPRIAVGLTPIRDHALLTEPVEWADMGFVRAGQGWTVLRPHPTGGLVVSGARWATPHMEVGETDVDTTAPRIQARLDAFLRERVGVDAAVVDRWAWGLCMARDGLPLIGPLPSQPRRIVATGFGPNPASFAMVAARAVADGILEGTGQLPDMVSSRRLVRWRLG